MATTSTQAGIGSQSIKSKPATASAQAGAAAPGAHASKPFAAQLQQLLAGLVGR